VANHTHQLVLASAVAANAKDQHYFARESRK
jgi:hypothetical protein